MEATVSLGKQLRLKRVIDRDGVSIICALDHGMTSPEFLDPLADVRARTAEAVAGGANVIMLSKGMARFAVPAFRPEVVAVAEVEEALRLGADAVVLFVALAGEDEPTMIERLAEVGEACEREGMPFIAEAEFPTTYAAVEDLAEAYGLDYLRRNVRLCAELGADIVKTNWPGDADRFAALVAAAGGVPLVLAGGSRIPDEELLHRMEAATSAGAIGCSVGRNIFMHANPEGITRALARVIRERWRAEEALGELRGVVAP
jgi:fructose-bisphosphate aldolase/2-amino-3,7-dideoxy-D-threo-hept-6-ulosonate synthase